ncbi:MAG: hypothetical protein AAB353_03620 [Candidatus Hydrogenedentota bacterium]
MGDASDMSELDRFMRSVEGRAHLEEIRQSLVQRTIASVDFINATHHIIVKLSLDDGTSPEYWHPELTVDQLRVDFEEVLEREYRLDYPERT